jgi:hypothetical protein
MRERDGCTKPFFFFFFFQGRGHESICLQIKCPDQAGAEVREFYQRQVVQLFLISTDIASQNVSGRVFTLIFSLMRHTNRMGIHTLRG